MQDRYTGDVGDFGKYGLLRSLTGIYPAAEPELSLGVVWYLTDEAIVRSDPEGDGRHIGYLAADKVGAFRSKDPELYDGLGDLVTANDRRVAAVRERGLLGGGAVFYEEPLRTSELGVDRQSRLADRESWLNGALDATGGCEVVFLDPDNGLEARSIRPQHKRAPKYVYLSEIEPFVARGQTVLIYHHLGRTGSHQTQISNWAQKLSDELVLSTEPAALRFSGGTGRAYFVLGAIEHARVIDGRLRTFLSGSWGELFAGPRPA